MNCNDCKNNKKDVPYIVHEAALAREERHIKRLVIALVTAIVLMFLSNAIWIWAWTSYDYASEESTYTYQQDGEGVNIVGSGNEVNNGAEGNDS